MAVSTEKIDASNETAEAQRLAARYRLNFIDLDDLAVDYSLVHQLPVDLMVRHHFVPLRRENGHTVIAMVDPSDLPLIDDLQVQLRTAIKVEVATRSAVESVLRKGDAGQRVLQEATEGFRASLIKDTDQGEEVLDLDRLSGDAEMSPIIKLVDTVVFTALVSRASDIQIETSESDVMVRYRIDGALVAAGEPIDIKHHQTIISRIKVMSELDIAERRIPQDGRFRMRIKGRRVDFRVSIMPSVHGEDAVIRILDKEQINEAFKDLRLDVVGFDPALLFKFRRFILEPYGMVLVTGPTGSGKTTTLYAALNEIRNAEDKLITIEDPVEYQLRGVTQIQVNMGVEAYNFVSSLNCVLAQRLVRVLCARCKRRHQPTDIELLESGLAPDKYRDRSFYASVGCEVCSQPGYRGRTAIHELLDLSDNIREIIIARRPGSDVRRAVEY